MAWSLPEPPGPVEREVSEGKCVSWDSELVGWGRVVCVWLGVGWGGVGWGGVGWGGGSSWRGNEPEGMRKHLTKFFLLFSPRSPERDCVCVCLV